MSNKRFSWAVLTRVRILGRIRILVITILTVAVAALVLVGAGEAAGGMMFRSRARITFLLVPWAIISNESRTE